MEKFLSGYRELSRASNIPIRTCRTLVRRGVLPFTKVGHRTFLFSPSRVEAALRKKEVTTATGGTSLQSSTYRRL
jgi:excisionase family DNA binding protein